MPGEWFFSWILEGRAIQDNWICPSCSLRKTGEYPTREYGPTIRFYDKDVDSVRILWIGAVNAKVNLLEVSFIDNQIIQQEVAIGQKTSLAKWVFSQIKPDSFKWEAYLSENFEDKGTRWNLTQEILAKRKM